MLREEPYKGFDMTWIPLRKRSVLDWKTCTQVAHGCRQLVAGKVGLSPITSATLVFSYFFKKTADYKSEEAETTSSRHVTNPGLHTCLRR